MTEEEKPRPMTLADWERIQQGKRDAQEALMQSLLSYKVEDRSNWKVLYPLRENDTPFGMLNGAAACLALPIADLPFMVQAYINMIETERTNRLCKCEWIIHPDDMDKPEGTRRIHKGAEAANCPVHTKLGFLLYFFDHYFMSKCAHCPPDCKDCNFTDECCCGTHVMYIDNELVRSVALTLPTTVADDPEITQDVMAKVAGLEDISGTFTGVFDAKYGTVEFANQETDIHKLECSESNCNYNGKLFHHHDPEPCYICSGYGCPDCQDEPTVDVTPCREHGNNCSKICRFRNRQ